MAKIFAYCLQMDKLSSLRTEIHSPRITRQIADRTARYSIIAPIAEGSCKMYAVVHKSTPLTSLFYRLPSWRTKPSESILGLADRVAATIPNVSPSTVYNEIVRAVETGRPAIIRRSYLSFYLVEVFQ